MKIFINGKEQELTTATTVAALLASLEIPKPGTAVAINEALVPRDRHETHELVDGDRVDILRAIGGG